MESSCVSTINLIDITMAVINLGILIVIIFQFCRQGKQLKEQRREFSLQSFQSGFFQLLGSMNSDTARFQVTDLYESIKQKFRKSQSVSDSELVHIIQTRSGIDIDARRPITSKILDLIALNMDEGLKKENAYYYSSVLSSVLKSVEVREYLLMTVKEVLVHDNKEYFKTAEKVHFFEILDKTTGIKEYDELNKKVIESIKRVVR